MARDRHISADAYARAFGEAAGRLPGAEASRKAALDALIETGIPTRRVEDWKYTDLRALADTALPVSGVGEGPVDRSAGVFGALDAATVAIVNGTLRRDLSDPMPEGVTLTRVADLLSDGGEAAAGLLSVEGAGPLAAMNAAFLQDGAVLTVARGAAVARPVRLLVTGAGEAAASYLRLHVVLGEGAELTLLEDVVPAAGHHLSVVGRTEVGQNAQLTHLRAVTGADGARVVAEMAASLARDARYGLFLGAEATTLSRMDASVTLTAPGAEARLAGLSLMGAAQHADNTVVVRHAAPHGTSTQVFKHVLGGEARGVFQGKIIVDRVAQKTDGHQLSQALLLSGRAEQDSKPELEIYADDVKCSHGSTVGQLDPASMFYLRSRGIPEAEARALLIRAFAAEALDEIAHEGAREALAARLDAWLAALPKGETA